MDLVYKMQKLSWARMDVRGLAGFRATSNITNDQLINVVHEIQMPFFIFFFFFLSLCYGTE